VTALDLVVEFDSRWRVGTGTTRSGVVDDETWADADRHLTIPASHLKRRLRERGEWLARLLGLAICSGRLAGNDPEVVQAPRRERRATQRQPTCVDRDPSAPCLTCRMFGAPRVEPGWQFRRGRLQLPSSTESAEALRAGERLRLVHNRVDPWARRTAEDLLFALEAGRPGLRFEARCEYLAGAAAPPDEAALLVGAVGALEALGARTRRGYGRCHAWVAGRPGGLDHDGWVKYLIDQVAPSMAAGVDR
jgi:CRISPR/Cas system CSM-associated protein Csm3 (group 7 of RAMP superfamily)